MSLRLASLPGGWRAFCSDPDTIEPDLRALLDAGKPIVLTARFSTPNGEKARTSAINNLRAAAAILLEWTGINVLDSLPGQAQLDMRLRTAPAIRTPRLGDGADIEHRFVKTDLRPQVPIVIIMATGTGKIAAQGFVQPFVQRMAQLVWDTEAAMVAVKRWDRTNRNKDLVGPLLVAMAEHQTWICTDKIFRPMDGLTRMMLMLESFAADDTSTGSDNAKRLGQADATGRSLVGGRVRYHMPSPPPPGMGLVSMKRVPGVPTEKVGYLDMPGCRPDPSTVADGLSEVRDAKGEVVDQVANVRFFLARYGDSLWMDDQRLHREMIRQRFSTVHLRRMNGASAHVTTTRGYTTYDSILANLDAFESGVVRRSPGGGLPVVEITDFFPPDGPWATSEDFARIRRYLQQGRERAGRQARLGLACLWATYNGQVCRTRSLASPSSAHQDAPCLRFRRLRQDGIEVRVDDHVPLPAHALAESMADALVVADSRALMPLLDKVAAVDAAVESGPGNRVAEIDAELGALRSQQQGLRAQLGEVSGDGKPVLRGGLLAAAQEQYDETEARIATLGRERDDVLAQIEASSTLPPQDAVEPDLLLHLLASLRDPYDLTYAGVWRRVIHKLEFWTTKGPHPAKTSRTLHWRGAIRIDGGSHGIFLLPFWGQYEYRRRRDLNGALGAGRARHVIREQQFLDAMLAGVPYATAELPGRHVNRSRVASLLGIEPGHPLFDCEDPAIVALATALLHRGQGNDTDVPDTDGRFRRAVERTHVRNRSARPWKRRIGPVPLAMYELAADSGRVTVAEVVERCETTPGTVHTTFGDLKRADPNWRSLRKKGYQLAPCPNCEAHDRRPGLIPEIRGLICLRCEHDEDGVQWPLKTYGLYVAGVDAAAQSVLGGGQDGLGP